MHPSLDLGEQTTIRMMNRAPLSVLEDLKVIFKERLCKLCPPGIVLADKKRCSYVCPRGNPAHRATTSW